MTLLAKPVWPVPVAHVEPQALPASGRGRIVVALEVPDGCHLQSHTPAEPFLIPTTLDLEASDGLTFGPAVYPIGETERFDWTPVVLNVYRGRVEIEVPVLVEAGASPGRRTVSGRVRYQGCTENACHPPAETSVRASLEITEKEERSGIGVERETRRQGREQGREEVGT